MFANRALLLVAFIATLGLLSEGEMEHWSGVYLRDSLGLSALAGGTGVAVFFGAMAVGRIGAASLINAFGTTRVLRTAGILAALGMAVSLATTQPVLVVTTLLRILRREAHEERQRRFVLRAAHLRRTRERPGTRELQLPSLRHQPQRNA